MIYYFDSLPSTNLYAKEHISTLKHGDIICCTTQTAGRGRNNHVWQSAAGGLYFTKVLKPQNLKHIAGLTQLMALSICSIINENGLNAHLKWPNDILCDGKKVCGILSELVFDGTICKGMALGAGININQQNLLVDKPSATLAQLGFCPVIGTFLQQIDTMFNIRYDSFIDNGFSVIKQLYIAVFPYISKQAAISTGSGILKGTVAGLSDDGFLMLNTAAGPKLVTMGDMDY